MPLLLRLRDEALLLRLRRQAEDDVHDRAALPSTGHRKKPGVRVDGAVERAAFARLRRLHRGEPALAFSQESTLRTM